MNEGNCLAAMTLADTHAHRSMYEFAKNYACQHFTTVVDDDDFLRLSVECITDLLRDRRLNCTTEEQVLTKLMSSSLKNGSWLKDFTTEEQVLFDLNNKSEEEVLI